MPPVSPRSNPMHAPRKAQLLRAFPRRIRTRCCLKWNATPRPASRRIPPPSSTCCAIIPSRECSAIPTTEETQITSAGICSATQACALSFRLISSAWTSSRRRITNRPTTTTCSSKLPRKRRREETSSMAIKLKETDVVIVGLGAAGGIAALPLVQAGLDVIGLEAGTWLTKRDFAPDELRNNFRGWPQAVQKANQEVPTHRPSASASYSPRPDIHPMMNAVGGTTLHYWAQSWRLNPWDFKVVSETARRYGSGRIPKGSTVEDWPFGLEELEPYYDKVEYEIGVSGKAGNLSGKLDPAGNIFEGPRKRDYPMPPLRGTGFTELMAGAARGLGWQPFPGPAAVNSQPYQGRSACAYHGFCNRGGCHVDAKGSTAVTTIPKAVETGRLHVVTRAHVTKLETDGQGRASGVTYLVGGAEYFQPAKVVLLASYVYENVRLLLLSKSKPYPNGFSNRQGQVGKHYFSHNQGASVTALFPWNLNNWYGLPAQGVAVDNWADDNFDHTRLDFIGGGNLWIYSDRRPIAAASMTTFGRAPAWGRGWKAFIKQNADRFNLAYLQKTTLPYEDNYLDL